MNGPQIESQPRYSREQFLRISAAIAGGVVLEAILPNVAKAEGCDDKVSCEKPEDGEPCDPNAIWEQYLEEYFGLTSDSKDRMSFVASGVNVRLVKRVYKELKPGRESDSSRETPLDDVDLSRPALVSHQIVKAGGTGFAEPYTHPEDNVVNNGYSYVESPLTGNPALRWTQTGPGQIYRSGVGVDGERRIYPAVIYISDRVFDEADGKYRIAVLDDKNLDRLLGIAYPCPPCEIRRFDPEQMMRRRTLANYNEARSRQGKESDVVYSDKLRKPHHQAKDKEPFK